MIFVVSTKSYFVILILEQKFISIISISLRQFSHFVFFCDLFVAVVAAGPDLLGLTSKTQIGKATRSIFEASDWRTKGGLTASRWRDA